MAPVPKLLIPEAKIQRQVNALARRISADYAGRTLWVVGVLKGGALFCADLYRRLTVPAKLDFLMVSSYRQGDRPQGRPQVIKDLGPWVEGEHVLLVDDIIDTGRTLAFLREHVRRLRPASLRAAVLLDKAERREVAVEVEYVGFTVPDRFIVGYGLDYADRHRNLPYLATLELEER